MCAESASKDELNRDLRAEREKEIHCEALGHLNYERKEREKRVLGVLSELQKWVWKYE